jgi:hypothetical protein
LGNITLSLIHAQFLSHWVPFVTIENAQGWGIRQILRTTLLAGTAHTLSTTLFNILTISGMLRMTLLANHGIRRLNVYRLQRDEQLIMGLTLICLAIFNFFIEL